MKVLYHYSVLIVLVLNLLTTSYVFMFVTQIKYKEDLQILRGLGCFLYDTPDMVRSRHLRKLWVSAPHPAPASQTGQEESLSVASVKGKFALNPLSKS